MSLNHDSLPEPDAAGELFVDFANTLEYERGEPVDAVPDIDALLAWLRERDLISDRGRATESARLRRDPDEAAQRIERFAHLRQLLHEVARLEVALRHAGAGAELGAGGVRQTDAGLRPRHHGQAGAVEAAGTGAAVAVRLADLGHGEADRGGDWSSPARPWGQG
mgnify:CR=1 FL=1